MAKTQNLSLNPTKISGTCGRLMCCLKYEQDAYEDLIRSAPKAESFVDTPDGRGTVVEVDLLRQRVKVRMEDEPETITSFSNDEIAVLRSGKAKKTDPPIPADLAPISGSGKRARKPESKEEKPALLDPIKFRYSEEAIVEEPEEEEIVEEVAAEDAPKKNNRRRNRNKGQRKDKPQEAAPVEAPPAPVEEAAPAEETPRKNNRRRHYYHHRRKPKQGE
jgi:hypothetical protein